MNTIKIKRGNGAPATGELKGHELGWDVQNDTLYIGVEGSDPIKLLDAFSNSINIDKATGDITITADILANNLTLAPNNMGNVSREVMKTLVGGSLITDGANTWTKIADFTVDSLLSNVHANLMIVGANLDEPPTAIIDISIDTDLSGLDLTTTKLSVVSITNNDTGMLSKDSFKLTTNSTTLGEPISLWMRKNLEDGIFSVYELAFHKDQEGSRTYNDGSFWDEVVPTDTHEFVSDWSIIRNTIHFDGDANFTPSIVSGNPVFTFDTDDNITYNRTINEYNFNIGGTSILDLDSIGLSVQGNIIISGSVDGRDVSVDGTALDLVVSEAVREGDTSTASMNFVIDEDDMASNLDTKIPTQQSVKTYVDNLVASNVSHQGGYDATTNTPNLDTAPAGVLRGHMWTVTVAGTAFFATNLEVGDVLIAEIDNPTLESHWTVVNKNLDAAGILASLLTVDGTGSLLDADVLDGMQPDIASVPNTIVQRDANGDITADTFIIDDAADGTLRPHVMVSGATGIIYQTTNNDFITNLDLATTEYVATAIAGTGPSADFAPSEAAVPDMTVVLGDGNVFDGTTLTYIAQQTTAAFVAPTTNPRIDRIVVDAATGVYAIVAGAEAASPVAPAIPANSLPVCQVALSVGQVSILNANITDERVFNGGGGTGGTGSATPAITYQYTATEAQTVFSGLDNNSKSLTYDVGYILVGVNGSWLDPSEYTATDGTSITLPAQPLGAQIQVLAFGTIQQVLNVTDNSDANWLTVDINENATFTGNISLGDTQYYHAGAGNDLSMYHDGSHSYIVNQTGTFYFDSNTTSGSIQFYTNDSVDTQKLGLNIGGTTPYVRLYYDGFLKFQTTASGSTTSNSGATANHAIDRSDIHGSLQYASRLYLQGRNSLGTTRAYGRVDCYCLDDTSGSEDSSLIFTTFAGGVDANRMHIRSGMYMDGAGGGDQGAGTINATGLFVNGVAVGGGSYNITDNSNANWLTVDVNENAVFAGTAQSAQFNGDGSWILGNGFGAGVIGSDSIGVYTYGAIACPSVVEYTNAETQAAAYVIDMSIAGLHEITMTGNVSITFSNVYGANHIQSATIVLIQDATGSRVPSFPASVKWEGGAVPVWSTAANAIDIITMFTYDGGVTWYANLVGQNYA